MKTLRTLVFFAILLLAFACEKEEEIPTKIFAGQGIEGARIGESMSSVESELGEAQYFSSSGSYYSNGTTITWSVLTASYDHLGITIYVDTDNQTVSSISLEAPYDGKTKDKLGIGSPKTDIEAALGFGKLINTYYEYDRNGIDFRYDDSNLVEKIRIYDKE